MGFLTSEMRLLNLQTTLVDELERAKITYPTTVSPHDGENGAVLERPAFHNEGTAPRLLTIHDAWDGDRPSAQARDRVVAFVRHLQQLFDRDNAIEAAGEDIKHPPPWAYLVHQMARTIVSNAGRDPCDLARLDPTRQQRSGYLTKIREATDQDARAGYEWAGLAAGVLATLERRTPVWEYAEQNGTAVVKIAQRLPLTVLQSLSGRLFDDVVDIPALRGSGSRIHRASTIRSGTTLFILERDHRPLMPAPAGIDLSWLQLIDQPVPSI